MAPYVEEVWKLQRRFSSFRAVHRTWAQDVVKYMTEHALPEDDHEAE